MRVVATLASVMALRPGLAVRARCTRAGRVIPRGRGRNGWGGAGSHVAPAHDLES